MLYPMDCREWIENASSMSVVSGGLLWGPTITPPLKAVDVGRIWTLLFPTVWLGNVTPFNLSSPLNHAEQASSAYIDAVTALIN